MEASAHVVSLVLKFVSAACKGSEFASRYLRRAYGSALKTRTIGNTIPELREYSMYETLPSPCREICESDVVNDSGMLKNILARQVVQSRLQRSGRASFARFDRKSCGPMGPHERLVLRSPTHSPISDEKISRIIGGLDAVADR